MEIVKSWLGKDHLCTGDILKTFHTEGLQLRREQGLCIGGVGMLEDLQLTLTVLQGNRSTPAAGEGKPDQRHFTGLGIVIGFQMKSSPDFLIRLDRVGLDNRSQRQ